MTWLVLAGLVLFSAGLFAGFLIALPVVSLLHAARDLRRVESLLPASPVVRAARETREEALWN
jgi:hypothetical protein